MFVGRELRPTALVVLLASLAEAVDPQWRAVHERRRLVAPISEAAQNRRTLERFTRGHPDNQICWDRDGLDGFINVIDAHQHPVPFGGPEVPFSLYTDWFIQHGTVFSVFMGIGQRIVKQNASAPDCCYYMHCPTYDYPVIPSAIADEVNAVAKLEHYYGKVRIRTSSRCMQVLTTTPPPPPFPPGRSQAPPHHLRHVPEPAEAAEPKGAVARPVGKVPGYVQVAGRDQRVQAWARGQRLLHRLHRPTAHSTRCIGRARAECL